jgi:hypothetical protein
MAKFLIMARKIIIPNCQLYYHREWKIASHYLIVTYPIRRWAVLAFGWLCSGQKRLLYMGAVMLSNAEAWEQVMDSTVEAIITTTSTKVASSEGNHIPSKTGNVLLSFVTALLQDYTRKRRTATDKSHNIISHEK